MLVAAALAAAGKFSQFTEETRAMAKESKSNGPLVVHNVYFTLNDGSPQNVAALLAACRKYLVNHEGVVFFATGTLADLARPVNDRGFDVGLHIVFADRAAHDKYQVSRDHLKFIEENRATWKQVRVFDSDAEQVADY
jgi:Stress responsive A/B Barrel Domain